MILSLGLVNVFLFNEDDERDLYGGCGFEFFSFLDFVVGFGMFDWLVEIV